MGSGEDKIRRILVVRMSAIGDIILTTPLLRAVRAKFPQAQIDFLTKSKYRELLEHHPLVHEVVGFDTSLGFRGLLRLVAGLRKEKYDLVLDLHSNPRSILVRLFCGAKMRRRSRKYSLERRLLKWFGINLMKNAPPVAERYFTALKNFGVKPDGLCAEIFPSSADLEKAESILSAAGLAGKALVGLAPGASRFTKIWPAHYFSAAGAKLAQELKAGIVILGGAEDKAAAAEVESRLKAEFPGPVMNLAGALSLLESAAVVRSVTILLSNDTALMHLASAGDTPVVAIFGPTTREMGFFPYCKKAAVIEKQGLDCRPCSLHGTDQCPEKHFRCMLDIEPQEVVRAAQKFFKEKPQ